jgi:enoyl-[acyl-carrier-protein] reductase (NADH)
MSFGCVMPSLPIADPNDISDAVIYLASDMSRAVTGTQLTVDMGATKV